MDERGTNNVELPSLGQLEIPSSVSHVLQKINAAKLIRAKQGLSEHLAFILNNVHRVLERSWMVAELEEEAQGDLSLEDQVDEKKKRALILEKLTNILQNSVVTQQDLARVLRWLSDISKLFENQSGSKSTGDCSQIDTDKWIMDMELQLSQWLDFLQQCVTKLVNVCSRISGVEKTPTAAPQTKTRAQAEPVDMQPLSPLKMLEDEVAANSKASELLILLQDFATSAQCNQMQSAVFRYIIKTVGNLAKAFYLRCKDFHELESKIRIIRTQESKLKTQCASLTTELSGTQEKKAALEICLQGTEAKFRSCLADNALLIAKLNQMSEEAPIQVDKVQRCHKVHYADCQTKTTGSGRGRFKGKIDALENKGRLSVMSTGDRSQTTTQSDLLIEEKEDDFLIRLDYERDSHTEESGSRRESHGIKSNRKIHDMSTQITAGDEYGTKTLKGRIERESRPERHPHTAKVSESGQSDGKLSSDDKIQTQKDRSWLITQNTKNESIDSKVATTRVSEEHDVKSSFHISAGEHLPKPGVLSLIEQKVDQSKPDTLLAVENFQKAIHYLLKQKSASSDIDSDPAQKITDENTEILLLNPEVHKLYRITEKKIEETLMKVKASRNLGQMFPEDQMKAVYSKVGAAQKPEHPEPMIEQILKIEQYQKYIKRRKSTRHSQVSGIRSLRPVGHPKKQELIRSGIFLTKPSQGSPHSGHPKEQKYLTSETSPRRASVGSVSGHPQNLECLKSETFCKRSSQEHEVDIPPVSQESITSYFQEPGSVPDLQLTDEEHRNGEPHSISQESLVLGHIQSARNRKISMTEEDKTISKQVQKHEKEKQYLTLEKTTAELGDHQDIGYYKMSKVNQLHLEQLEHTIRTTEKQERLQKVGQEIWLSPDKNEANKLNLLRKADLMQTLPPQLQSQARDLSLQALEADLTRLGNLFHKYISFRLIQSVRQNLISRLASVSQLGKENEVKNLRGFLDRLDDYQRKSLQRWADKQAFSEQERSSCLSRMDYLSNKLRTSSELHLSRPCPVLQEAERWSREVKEFQSSSHDRFIIWNPPLPKKSSSFALSDYPRETGTQDNMGLYRIEGFPN
ncbi:uncharacterized protein LOC142490110 isoform X2 [Ascaphus truei]|uniref:uncharacterized protein LOC142490110 isoform X2 n=1 Tax=Ascaphus truei TaxID=8439 RepID=UPI003F5A0E3F